MHRFGRDLQLQTRGSDSQAFNKNLQSNDSIATWRFGPLVSHSRRLRRSCWTLCDLQRFQTTDSQRKRASSNIDDEGHSRWWTLHSVNQTISMAYRPDASRLCDRKANRHSPRPSPLPVDEHASLPMTILYRIGPESKRFDKAKPSIHRVASRPSPNAALSRDRHLVNSAVKARRRKILDLSEQT
ncbi:hypothetical protein BDP81DRAFT_432553 [Colletotrichum phormii]|uniref:Uncharacterized protein n=1 Tax=Colletotrichum phormii TaxID=359342 RepID=A0AAI9ZLT4_9PEZI|nr:uncharacterized protein BDP81DRAFT_432553 [Colletotrichum phormii]KAK1634294.1 hypothetical protein BDP81DRAFT_432553 [Colletotrichum phormii]